MLGRLRCRYDRWDCTVPVVQMYRNLWGVLVSYVKIARCMLRVTRTASFQAHVDMDRVAVEVPAAISPMLSRIVLVGISASAEADLLAEFLALP